jgi:hypothetical protein
MYKIGEDPKIDSLILALTYSIAFDIKRSSDEFDRVLEIFDVDGDGDKMSEEEFIRAFNIHCSFYRKVRRLQTID